MTSDKNIFLDQVDYVVRSTFANEEEPPEEDAVRHLYESVYDSLALVYPNESAPINRNSAIDQLVKKYCTELDITKKVGFAYKDVDECRPWLLDAEAEIEKKTKWYYWRRYKNYLIGQKKWDLAAVRSIENDTFAILDLMANPQTQGGFERRGLVVASVQSGKTANYIGLICRAADAGYKIIIVMAGVLNVLRNQTQIRIEEGFAGFDIVGNQRRPVGVGITNQEHKPILCTSRERDFNLETASVMKGIKTLNTKDPMLFVIKKNSNSLEQISKWLQSSADADDPLLLIDDEADNASINGNYRRESREDEPSRINGQIRNIFNFFHRKCYVGYTATPFANILIDPDIDNDDYGKDLFPSSFIYTLEESSAYFGADKVFGDIDELHPQHLRYIFDIDEVLPPKHRKDFNVTALPESLKKAVRTFVLATDIRALRGDADAHSSMMINVSPYTAPQKAVAGLVDDYLAQLKSAIMAFGCLPCNLALKSSEDLRRLKDTWTEEYANSTEFDWNHVQAQLPGTVQTLHVVSINTDSNDRLEYDLHTEHVIAVGGYRLSRGLTLEGLIVSYYSRNAKAYDALMQMARWFGYRPHYEDLCRIWMTDQAAGWYKFVADSTDELFDELRNMRQVNRTPRNYGLKIQQNPGSLIITARNKMGTGKNLKLLADLNCKFIETVSLERDPNIINSNRQAAASLINSASSYRVKGKPNLFKGVPVDLVVHFLNSFINDDTASVKSESRSVLNYIQNRRDDGELGTWDLFIAHGSGDEVEIADGIRIKQEVRYPGNSTDSHSLVIGAKQKLSSRGIEKEGLTPEQKEIAEEKCRKQSPDKKDPSYDPYYRRERKYPLIVIHPVLVMYSATQRKNRNPDGNSMPTIVGWDSWEHSESAVGWSISFPYTDRHVDPVEYVFNQVALDNLRSESEEDSNDDTEDDF